MIQVRGSYIPPIVYVQTSYMNIQGHSGIIITDWKTHQMCEEGATMLLHISHSGDSIIEVARTGNTYSNHAYAGTHNAVHNGAVKLRYIESPTLYFSNDDMVAVKTDLPGHDPMWLVMSTSNTLDWRWEENILPEFSEEAHVMPMELCENGPRAPRDTLVYRLKP